MINHKHAWSILLTASILLLFPVGSAYATEGHGLTGSFGSETSSVKDTEPLSKPTGIAIDEKTKEVYVIDSGNGRVARFSLTGEPDGSFNGNTSTTGVFLSPNGIAVDNDPASPSYGDVYISDAGHNAVDKYEIEPDNNIKYVNQLTGTPAVPFSELSGIAVDPSGDLWVYEVLNGEGSPVEFDNHVENIFVLSGVVGPHELSGFAVNSTSDVYIINSVLQNLQEFLGTGSEQLLGTVDRCGCVTGVGIDPANSDVYADQGTSIAEYAPAPEPRSTTPPLEPPFGSKILTAGTGLAITTQHVVYVADTTANDIVIFGLGPKPAAVLAEAPNSIQGVSATLKGKLEGGETSYQFAYNTNGTCEDGNTTPPVTANGIESVSVKVTGLTAKTEYTYCLIAENKYGQATTTPETFETKPSVPVIENTSSSVTKVQAVLNASVNPELEPATCVFQYGKNENYEHETPCEPATLGEGSSPIAVNATLKSLDPDTTYDYRVLANNGTGHQASPNETFTTEVITPTQVETGPATEVTPTSAKLGGQVNPQGGATYYIQYGPPTCSLNGNPNYAWWLCATTTIEAGPLSGDTLQNVTPIQITGLTPGTTYKYWILATNKNGTERGEEKTFTTSALPGTGPLPIKTPPTITPQVIAPTIQPAPKVTIAAATIRGNTLTLSVRTTVAGTITITGTGLPKTTKTLTAGTHPITIPLKNRKRQHKHTKIALRITLKSAGTNATASKTIKL